MTKRFKKKITAKKTKKKTLSIEVLNKISHLENLVLYSLRAADGTSEDLDILFKGQANKLRNEIDKLKE